MYRRADTEWMKGSFGLSFHWTSGSSCLNGTHLPYSEAVDGFDIMKVADALSCVGATHCIFTLTHAKQYLAFPNTVLEQLLSGRTTRRDMIGELIEELARRGIRFIAYYNHSCNMGDDPDWETASGYAGGWKEGLDRFAANILNIVSFTARRYGKGISAWWFDSSYSVDPRGPVKTIHCDMGDWRFPWEQLNEAAKSGNRDCAVTFNAGLGRTFLYADCQDYYAGECSSLDQAFEPLPVDMQDHRWMTFDNARWVFNEKANPCGFETMRFLASDFIRFIRENRAAGRMVTLNVNIDQLGNVNPRIRELADAGLPKGK